VGGDNGLLSTSLVGLEYDVLGRAAGADFGGTVGFTCAVVGRFNVCALTSPVVEDNSNFSSNTSGLYDKN
jgi:hypothetical protein